MHQQIKASPDNTAENIRAVIDALAALDINIEAIAPDFDPPHVRVLVEHGKFKAAFDALQAAGLEPTPRRCPVPIRMPNAPGALKRAMDKLESEGHTLESILVLASRSTDTQVSFGIAGDAEDAWDEVAATDLRDLIEADLKNLE